MNVLALVLAAAVAGSAPELVAPGLSATGVSEEKAAELNVYFAQALGAHGVKVVTKGESPGAAGRIEGSIALEGETWVVNLKILATNGGREVAGYATRAPSEKAVLQFLEESAADFAAKVGVKPSARRRTWIIPAVGAGVLLVTSGFLMLFAKLDENRLRDGTGIVTYEDVTRVRGRGETLQFTGVALFAVGAASAIASLILFGFPRTDAAPAPRLSLMPLPGGGAFGSVSFALP